MSQPTAFGEAELETFLRVDRKDGSTEFYRVADGVTTPISRDEYDKGTA